jgi:hypothetical protein
MQWVRSHPRSLSRGFPLAQHLTGFRVRKSGFAPSGTSRLNAMFYRAKSFPWSFVLVLVSGWRSCPWWPTVTNTNHILHMVPRIKFIDTHEPCNGKIHGNRMKRLLRCSCKIKDSNGHGTQSRLFCWFPASPWNNRYGICSRRPFLMIRKVPETSELMQLIANKHCFFFQYFSSFIRVVRTLSHSMYVS